MFNISQLILAEKSAEWIWYRVDFGNLVDSGILIRDLAHFIQKSTKSRNPNISFVIHNSSFDLTTLPFCNLAADLANFHLIHFSSDRAVMKNEIKEAFDAAKVPTGYSEQVSKLAVVINTNFKTGIEFYSSKCLSPGKSKMKTV